jgi:enoyl-CoA hydratase/carnithine racemase
MRKHLLVERDGPVVRLTLNRPERRNALNEGLVAELDDALAELETAAWCRAVVLTGAGSAFCAGGDLSDLPDGAIDPVWAAARHRRFLRLAERLQHLPKPTVAAINGATVGAGLSLALLCDEVLLHHRARVGLGFLQVGLPPDLLMAATLQRRCGWTVAADLLHTGRTLTASEAVELRLAHAWVAGDVVVTATARAQALAELSPFAFAATKALLREAAGGSAQGHELEVLAVGVAVASPEFAIATAAYRPLGSTG